MESKSIPSTKELLDKFYPKPHYYVLEPTHMRVFYTILALYALSIILALTNKFLWHSSNWVSTITPIIFWSAYALLVGFELFVIIRVITVNVKVANYKNYNFDAYSYEENQILEIVSGFPIEQIETRLHKIGSFKESSVTAAATTTLIVTMLNSIPLIINNLNFEIPFKPELQWLGAFVFCITIALIIRYARNEKYTWIERIYEAAKTQKIRAQDNKQKHLSIRSFSKRGVILKTPKNQKRLPFAY